MLAKLFSTYDKIGYGIPYKISNFFMNIMINSSSMDRTNLIPYWWWMRPPPPPSSVIYSFTPFGCLWDLIGGYIYGSMVDLPDTPLLPFFLIISGGPYRGSPKIPGIFKIFSGRMDWEQCLSELYRYFLAQMSSANLLTGAFGRRYRLIRIGID